PDNDGHQGKSLDEIARIGLRTEPAQQLRIALGPGRCLEAGLRSKTLRIGISLIEIVELDLDPAQPLGQLEQGARGGSADKSGSRVQRFDAHLKNACYNQCPLDIAVRLQ